MKDITVIGLGYVGLPVACAFARAGVRVNGIEKNPSITDALRTRKYNYTEPMLNGVLGEVLDKTLFLSNEIKDSNTYIITVQTPVDGNRHADNSYVEAALTELAAHVKNGDLIILESTVPIGSNEKFYSILRNQVSDSVDFLYCYCPESILPGNIFYEIENNHRVIGGQTAVAAERAKKVYDVINCGKKSLTDIRTAEFVKLVQNAHRDVELAFVNQLSIMCDAEGVDAFSVINIANNHPRCNLLYPGSGVGGHCIAVDPYFLIERYGRNAALISAAREVNNYKPVYIAEKAISLINNDKSKIIGVLGLSYKADCEDCRESSGLTICRYLKEKGFTVLANETNSPQKIIDGIYNCEASDVIKQSDIIIIAQKHTKYKNLKFSGKQVIDCVNLYGN